MRVQSDLTELNWHGLVFGELTNGESGQAHWSLVDAYVTLRPLTPLEGAYCNALLLAHWLVRQKLNHDSSVQFSYVALYAPLHFFERASHVSAFCAPVENIQNTCHELTKIFRKKTTPK